MAAIISYFNRNDDLSAMEGMEVYEFTGDPVAFVKDCMDRYRESYISNDKINSILAKSKTATRKDIIERRLPKKTQNKAGDFGEILSYYLWTETWAADTNIRPMKLRWKENPDIPSHLVDVILLKREDSDNASINDKMVTIESKVWTSRMGDGHSSLSEALEGALKDETERAAKAIPYLVIQYERDDEYGLAEQVKRFGDPVTVAYQKAHCAMAIVDASQMNDHLANFDKALKAANPHIPIYFLPFNNLKAVYLEIYNNLPNK